MRVVLGLGIRIDIRPPVISDFAHYIVAITCLLRYAKQIKDIGKETAL